MMQVSVEKLVKNSNNEENLSLNDKISREKHRFVYFHGKDIRTKKFQKHINRKSRLTKVILTNSVIIVSLILIAWIVIAVI
ncbi:MAG: hypothetical protein ACFFAK_07610 [Promethearchaeota archaeon]